MQVVCAAPSPDIIDAAIDQLECVSEIILQFDQKYVIGNLWSSVYFPFVMQTNSLYGCRVHEESDK